MGGDLHVMYFFISLFWIKETIVLFIHIGWLNLCAGPSIYFLELIFTPQMLFCLPRKFVGVLFVELG